MNINVPRANDPIVYDVLFSKEIPVGSIFISLVDIGIDKIDISRSIFVCCNASQRVINKKMVKNNLFWYDITPNTIPILPNK